MNRCEEVQERLMLQVAEANEPGVRLHLVECDQCRNFFDDLCALEQLTREMSASCEPPRDFENLVLDKLPGQSWVRSLMTHALVPLLLAAAVFVMGSTDSFRSEAPADTEAELEGLEQVSTPAPEMEPDYVDVVIEDPVRGRMIVRVPSVIQVQRTSQTRDFYVHNVSY